MWNVCMHDISCITVCDRCVVDGHGQAKDKVATMRSRLDKGLAGPRTFSDSYVVGGHTIFVYPPRQWLRDFARGCAERGGQLGGGEIAPHHLPRLVLGTDPHLQPNVMEAATECDGGCD